MIAALHQLLCEKKISCTELTKCYLSAIAKEKEPLNAYITLTSDFALETAAQVDARIAAGHILRPLEGIPMALKDNISTFGIQTSCGSRMLQGYCPPYDASIWSFLRTQGAILLGKNNMDEFAMGSSGETSYFGGAVNPLNCAYVTGGSSSGGAAAVAGGQAVYAIGSDTGGSIRQPASFCGLVGVKPTYGRVSRYGMVAQTSSLDQLGPIAANAADAALILETISFYDPHDATSLNPPYSADSHNLSTCQGIRIGIIEECMQKLESDVALAMQRSLDLFKQLGATFIPLSIPILAHALPAYMILSCAESASNLSRFDFVRFSCLINPLAEHQTDAFSTSFDQEDLSLCQARSSCFGAEVKRRILLGNYMLRSGYYEAYYQKAQLLRRQLSTAFAMELEHCDLLITPTSPTTAFLRNLPNDDPTADDQRDICTVAANLTGLPAISIPCGTNHAGLPVGLQLIGSPWSESALLRIANLFEQAGHFCRAPVPPSLQSLLAEATL